MRIEGVKELVPTELCESGMAGHQELEILQMPIPKGTKFLGRLHIDIEGPFKLLFQDFDFFFY